MISNEAEPEPMIIAARRTVTGTSRGEGGLDMPPRLEMLTQPGSHFAQAAQINDATHAGIAGCGGERQSQGEVVFRVRPVAGHHRMDEIEGDVAAREVSGERGAIIQVRWP